MKRFVIFGEALDTAHETLTLQPFKDQVESLVDLEKDPGEMTNLAGNPTHAETLKRHRGMLAAWCRKYGDVFPVPA